MSSDTAKKALALSQPDGAQKLDIIIKGSAIKPGQYIPRADAAQLPELKLSPRAGTFIALCIDLDAPFKALPVLGPILHWLQPDIKLGQDGVLAAGATSAIAPYIGPAPPPFAAPHRYVFYVYEQPEGFDAGKFRFVPEGQVPAVTKRMFYDADKFVREAGLAEMVAANYLESN